jgi:hypothetical protein
VTRILKSFSVAVVVYWIASGSSLTAFPSWGRGSFHIVVSYTEAMAVEVSDSGPADTRWLTGAVVTLSLGVVAMVVGSGAFFPDPVPRARAALSKTRTMIDGSRRQRTLAGSKTYARLRVRETLKQRFGSVIAKPIHLPILILDSTPYRLVADTARRPTIVHMPAAAGISAGFGSELNYSRLALGKHRLSSRRLLRPLAPQEMRTFVATSFPIGLRQS